jgi:hypothetical protein
VILGNSQKKRSKNCFVSLLLSGVLLGVGVGVPAQIIGSSSASAVGVAAQLALTRPAVGTAAGAAFTTHHDPRLNADGRTMIPDNVEQHGADRDPLANRDIDQRTAGLMHGRGEQHTLLFEWKGGKRGRL